MHDVDCVYIYNVVWANTSVSIVAPTIAPRGIVLQVSTLVLGSIIVLRGSSWWMSIMYKTISVEVPMPFSINAWE